MVHRWEGDVSAMSGRDRDGGRRGGGGGSYDNRYNNSSSSGGRRDKRGRSPSPERCREAAPKARVEKAVKAQTTEKNGEISCSVVETNRIRAELGLKPLNVGAGSGRSGGSSTSTGNAAATAAVKDDGGEISCSVDETNRLRAELGLKPLNTNAADKGAVASANFQAAESAKVSHAHASPYPVSLARLA